MRAKVINQNINNKIRHWISSIGDENLREELLEKVIVTGGCITSMLLDEKVNDYDVYLSDIKTARKLAEYYVDKFKLLNPAEVHDIQIKEENQGIKIYVKSAGITSEAEKNSNIEYQYFEGNKDDDSAETYVQGVCPENQDLHEHMEAKAFAVENEMYRPIFLSSNAITLSDRIQIVLRFVGDVSNIHANYDFVHCTNHWNLNFGKWPKLYLNKEALEATITKELRYVGSKYPVCSIFRIRKFIKRGWYINAGQLFKIMFQISELNLSDYKTLEDQLTGVDAAYFREVLDIVKKEKGDDRPIERSYLMQVIDKIF